MKNFRKAAVAVATASAVAFAGTSVAGAQDAPADSSQLSTEIEAALSGEQQEGTDPSAALSGEQQEGTDPSAALSGDTATDEANGSSKLLTRIGAVLGADQYVDGTQLWGSEAGKNLPGWAIVFKWGTIAAVIGAVAGAIIGGINQLKNMGLIKDGQ